MSEQKEVKETRVTNAQFAKTDQSFQEACSEAGVEPTHRQASKWRRKKGAAYKRGRLKVVQGGI